MSDPYQRAFGKFQGEKVVDSRPTGTGRRYQCGLCDEVCMSDEALQIHILKHGLDSLTGKLEEIRNLLEGRI